jgi:hypothetical protein
MSREKDKKSMKDERLAKCVSSLPGRPSLSVRVNSWPGQTPRKRRFRKTLMKDSRKNAGKTTAKNRERDPQACGNPESWISAAAAGAFPWPG